MRRHEGRGDRDLLRQGEGTHAEARPHAPLGRVRAEGSARGRLFLHEPRGLPHRARRLRLLAHRAFPRVRAVHDRRRQHVAMSYYGSVKVVPHYNVMGVAKASLEASTRYLAYDLGRKNIRVNCISRRPRADARRARHLGLRHDDQALRSPCAACRSCTTESSATTGTFLASDGASGITGQVIYVDGGYEIMGM